LAVLLGELRPAHNTLSTAHTRHPQRATRSTTHNAGHRAGSSANHILPLPGGRPVKDRCQDPWRKSHRSHFGSRYKLGCCGHAGLFGPQFDSLMSHLPIAMPAQAMVLLVAQNANGCPVTPKGVLRLAKCHASATRKGLRASSREHLPRQKLM